MSVKRNVSIEKRWPMIWLWIAYLAAVSFFLIGPAITLFGLCLGGWAWIIFLAISTLYPIFFMIALAILVLGTVCFCRTYIDAPSKFGTAAILYGEIMAIMIISCVHYIFPFELDIMPQMWVFPIITLLVVLIPIISMIILHVRKKTHSKRCLTRAAYPDNYASSRVFRREIVFGAFTILFTVITIILTFQHCNFFSCH